VQPRGERVIKRPVQFVDEVLVEVRAGNGGNGAVAFRRERYIPYGGPSGGDGGRGGDIVLVTDTRLTTLLDLRYRRKVEAKSGENGRGSDMYGRGAADLELRIPPGTQVFDAETGTLIVDLAAIGERYVIAKGGRGGRGNLHFATSFDRAPRRAEPGEPGEVRQLRLELKLLADVGLLGYPNVGKSTFIASVSRARPKIADYPFTTLTPNLGVASLDDGPHGEGRSFVVADIPGIIEGASEGAGLGLRFLKHIERTRVLFHIVTLDPDPARAPGKDFDTLLEELRRFDEALAGRPMIVGVSKIDLPDVRAALPNLRRQLKRRGHTVLPFSAATGEGVREVLEAMETILRENPIAPTPRAAPLPPRGRPQGDGDTSDGDTTDDGDASYGEYVRDPHDGLDEA
jgi:GTP-binding protein